MPGKFQRLQAPSGDIRGELHFPLHPAVTLISDTIGGVPPASRAGV